MRRHPGAAIILAAGIGAAVAAAAQQPPPRGRSSDEASGAPRPVRRHLERSGPPRWVAAGFGGGGAFIGLAFDRAHPGVVYASSDVAGVFRSGDYGDHWEMRSLGLGNYEVSSLVVDPFDSHTLYAGVGALADSDRSGIYVSHDAALTWQLLPASHANHMTFRRMRTLDAIAPDPSLPGVILAGTRSEGIWRSPDGGVSWVQVLAAPLTDAPLFQPGMAPDDPTSSLYPAAVATVAFDPANPTTVYAALDGAGVYKSNLGGIAGSWRDSSSGLPPRANLRDLAVGAGGVLYVAMGALGVYRSADGGASWHTANGNLPLEGVEISSIATRRDNSQIAYATLVTYDYPSLWKTTDGGVSWGPQGTVAFDQEHNPTREWDQGQTYAWQVRLDPSDQDRLFYVDFWGIARSDDGAVTATEKIVGAQDTCVSSLTIDADHPEGQPDVVYATQWDDGVVASRDRGQTWAAVQPRAWDAAIVGHYWDFVIVRSGGTKVYLTSSTTGWPETCRVQRSLDTRTWTTVLSLPRPDSGFVGAVTLAADPKDPTRLYAAVDGGNVYTSTNAGLTWSPTSGQPADNSFTYALDVDDQGRVFVGTLHAGLYRSLDHGVSWSHVLDQLGSVFRLAVSPGAVYAAGIGDDADLYRTTDGGGSWQRLSSFAPGDDGDGGGLVGMAVAIDPVNPDHILFSLADTWHSADAGAGVAESTDGGVSWHWSNAGLGLLSVGALAVAPDGTLYAGTTCGSVWRRPAR